MSLPYRTAIQRHLNCHTEASESFFPLQLLFFWSRPFLNWILRTGLTTSPHPNKFGDLFLESYHADEQMDRWAHTPRYPLLPFLYKFSPACLWVGKNKTHNCATLHWPHLHKQWETVFQYVWKCCTAHVTTKMNRSTSEVCDLVRIVWESLLRVYLFYVRRGWHGPSRLEDLY